LIPREACQWCKFNSEQETLVECHDRTTLWVKAFTEKHCKSFAVKALKDWFRFTVQSELGFSQMIIVKEEEPQLTEW